MPRPLRTGDDCSGKFRLRIPKQLHAALVNEALEQGISLNSYVIHLLSYRFGKNEGRREAIDEIQVLTNQQELARQETSSCLTIGADDDEVLAIKSETKSKTIS